MTRQWVEPDAPAPDPRPVKRNGRVSDDRYCANCGWLFCDVADARKHRAEVHPIQARFERRNLEVLGAH